MPRPEPARRQRWAFWLAALAALAGVVVIGALALRDDPVRLLHRGAAIVDRDPRAAAALLERSIAAAGGEYPDAQLLLCQALGRQNRWIEALGCFSLIRDKSSLDGKDLMALAAAATAGGEPILAEQALEAALATDHPKPEALAALIPVRLALGHEEQALADCRQLAALAPQLPLPHVTQARILRRRRDILAASAAYRAALARTTDAGQAATLRRELVEVRIQEGNGSQARREFDQIPADSMPADERALLLAHILRLERRSGEGLDAVNEYLAQRADHPDALLLRGTLRLDLGQYEPAAGDFARLVAAQPFHKEAHYLLGQAYQKLGRGDEAKAHLATSQRLAAAAEEIRTLEAQAAREPANVEVRLRLAALCETIGEAEMAARWRASAAGLEMRGK